MVTICGIFIGYLLDSCMQDSVGYVQLYGHVLCSPNQDKHNNSVRILLLGLLIKLHTCLHHAGTGSRVPTHSRLHYLAAV